MFSVLLVPDRVEPQAAHGGIHRKLLVDSLLASFQLSDQRLGELRGSILEPLVFFY